ncbi:MAG TPA: sigma factor-like helix-turn-helix DNA-binding protein [Pseudomonadales bacterium]|nr:sigma factor-like helix-turn-helix DNA-binding protein [Pseudomonadales bacterium]
MANRHTSPWDAELVARAAGLKRAGFSAKEIAKRLGVTVGAVNTKMSRTGAKSPGGRAAIRDQSK